MALKKNGGTFDINVKTYGNLKVNNRAIKTIKYNDTFDINYDVYAPTELNREVIVTGKDFKLSDENAVTKLVDFAKDAVNVGKDAVELWKRTGASITNFAVMSITEGAVSFIEAGTDAAIMLDGLKNSVYTGLWDIGVGIFTGDWSFSTTESLWVNTYMPFVAKDFTNTIFDGIYSTKFFKGLDDASFKFVQRDGGWAYEVGEGVGYFAGIVVVSYFTGGAGGAVTYASSAITAGVTAAASLGKNSQKNFNQAYATAEEEGRDVNLGDVAKATGRATVSSAIDFGVMYAAGATSPYFKGLKEAGKTVAPIIQKAAPIAIKTAKPLLNETADLVFYGDKINWKDVGVESASIVIAETAGTVFKDVSGAISKANSSAKPTVSTVDKAAINNAVGEIVDDAATPSEFMNASSSEVSKAATKTFSGMLKTVEKKTIEKTVKEASGGGFEQVVENIQKSNAETN